MYTKYTIKKAVDEIHLLLFEIIFSNQKFLTMEQEFLNKGIAQMSPHLHFSIRTLDQY